jgi:ArsR family transcriptional regulator
MKRAPNRHPSRCCPPPAPAKRAQALRGPQADRELAKLAKALGHPARVAIVRLLIERNTCVCGELVDELPLAQSTVSQHLAALQRAGLIRGEIDGPRSCYCLEPNALARLERLVVALGGGS